MSKVFILGVNVLGSHDAAACLIQDGQIIAFAEEERFTRIKKAPGEVSKRSAEWCLRKAGISLADVDLVAVPFTIYGAPPRPDDDTADKTFGVRYGKISEDPELAKLGKVLGGADGRDIEVAYVSHHLAHAASAYRCSGIEDDTAILVVDGEGDLVSTTIARGSGGNIEALRQFPVKDSLGLFYAALTAYLGLGVGGEGKAMGLAPYGDNVYSFADVIRAGDYGYEVELPFGLEAGHEVGTQVMRAWHRYFIKRFGFPRKSSARYDETSLRPKRAQRLEDLNADLAASGQAALEDILLRLAALAMQEAGTRRLAVAGGVHLNCSANGSIYSGLEIDEFFVQPVADDAGAVLGAAVEASYRAGASSQVHFSDVGLGPDFSQNSINTVLDECGADYQLRDDIAAATAACVADGMVVGWFQGGLEVGPRALGHRSILALPTADSRDRVNRIKRRDAWRPLSPSMKREAAPDSLRVLREAPYMIVRDYASPAAARTAPGVVHVDGSVRPQLVSHEANPKYWSLLDGLERITGMRCVINTSFNDEAEPIVCSPLDAVRTFFTTGLDALAIGDALIVKKRQSL